MSEQLRTQLLATQEFREAIDAITARSVVEQFPGVDRSLATGQHVDLGYLLECAATLAHGDDAASQESSLRIAHFVLTHEREREHYRVAAGLVLDILSNRPALNLAVARDLIRPTFLDDVPPPLLLDHLRRQFAASAVDPFSGDITILNRFQVRAEDALRDFQWVSISAPTSAGKSFVLKRVVREALAQSQGKLKRIVFLVPTRALVQEIEQDLKSILLDIQPPSFVSSIPRWPKEADERATIFVFTQERLQILFRDSPSFAPDLLIVDEAQKVGEGPRGILLETVLEESRSRNPAVRMVFASPMTRNPEVLLDRTPSDSSKRSIRTEHVAVNQNIIWVSQAKTGSPRTFTMELCRGEETVPLGTFDLPFLANTFRKRLAFVAAALGGEGGSLIYANLPSEAEDIARLLAGLSDRSSSDPELGALLALVKTTIHPRYALVETVMHGVAFHYGNMPLIIRVEIERLFRIGKIRYLVCTSTLIEGVNLPALSIFMRGPTKGRSRPMSELDFWNLAGRAGRQGMEFQGNVVCIDPEVKEVWKQPPPRSRRPGTIRRASETILTTRFADLSQYIESESPRSTRADVEELESVFTYLMDQSQRFSGLRNSPLVAGSLQLKDLDQLQELCNRAREKCDLPAELLERNPGVSPFAQRRLLDHLLTKTDLETAVPVHPSVSTALDSYVSVVGNIGKFLSGDPAALAYPRALLVVHWMRGHSLARIINEEWRYWEPKGRVLARVIRETMENVEQYARFRFAKYSSCYIDVLRHCLTLRKRTDLRELIPPLTIWLEFGTSVTTQLSLMGIGLSRTAAIIVSDLLPNPDLDEAQVLVLLRRMDIHAQNLSPIVAKEVETILASSKST